MAGLSEFAQLAVANWVTGTPIPSTPASLVIALSTTAINDDGTGITEPAAIDGYTRQAVTLSAPVHTEGAGTVISNTNPIIFGPAVNVSWSAMIHAAVFDDLGNMLFKGPVATPRTASVGDTLSFGSGVIQFNVR